jgi:hypothetical protein
VSWELRIMMKRYVPDFPSAARRAGSGVAVLSALGLALAACTSPGSPQRAAAGSASARGTVAGATYHGMIYVSSQVSNGPQSWHITREFTDRVPDERNCAAAAEAGDGPGIFQVPSPRAPDPQDNIEVRLFHGPGTYPPAVMEHDRSDSIMLTGKSGLRKYDITTSRPGRAAGKEVLFLNSDGSGQLVYSGAHLDGESSGPAVAGLISWSCTS